MFLHRRLKALICRVMIGNFAFPQLAVVAHACPSAASSPCAQMAMSDAGMALDDNAPNVCMEHCRFGQQSADTAAQPQLQVPVTGPHYALPLAVEPGAGCQGNFPTFDTAPAKPPPHAILHCVLRI